MHAPLTPSPAITPPEYDRWRSAFAPRPNPFRREAAHDGCLFGAAPDELHAVLEADHQRRAWSLVAEHDTVRIVPGFRQGAVGFFITQRPATAT